MFSCLSVCSQEMECGGQTTHEGCVGMIFSSALEERLREGVGISLG